MAADLMSNRLLSGLDDHERQIIARHVRPMSFGSGYSFFQDGQEMHHAFFVVTGLISLVTTLSDGFGVETAIIGREGAIGLTPDLRPSPSIGSAIGQAPGEALQIDLGRLAEAADSSAVLRSRISRFADQISADNRQSAVCLARHDLEPRLCRWLLKCQDRLGRDLLPLTQEFLGHMLGSQRSTVSQTAARLEKAGLIRYSRGRITVLDRPGLEARACECYATLRQREREFGIDPD